MSLPQVGYCPGVLHFFAEWCPAQPTADILYDGAGRLKTVAGLVGDITYSVRGQLIYRRNRLATTRDDVQKVSHNRMRLAAPARGLW
jgi:hypothetical protein